MNNINGRKGEYLIWRVKGIKNIKMCSITVVEKRDDIERLWRRM